MHTEGPLLVIAGPGSGKTRVITRRAAYIASTVASPREVLAITFTNKAAGEMRDRIAALGVGRSMWVHTFHALCARLLREFGDAVGIRPGFSIFDDADSRSAVRDALERCKLSADNWPPRRVQNVISDAKTKMMGPAEFEANADDYSARTIAKVYHDYQRSLHEQNACDFDDLLMHVASMLGQNDAIREELSNRFRYLLIDEYQDTNQAQYLIAKRLSQAHRNICATGDPDQSIYAWRGANIGNILSFEEDYPEATVIRLEQNFRSTGGILSAASTVIANNLRRKHKELWTTANMGDQAQIWACEDEQVEAQAIADDIKEYCTQGGQPGDVAIFYRINSLTRVLEDALRDAGIPYQIARGVEFYNRKEVRDVLAYARAVANPADETALLRAINTPARGIGNVTIGRLQSYARENGITFDEAIARVDRIDALKAARKKIEPFAALLRELRKMPAQPVADIVEAAIRKSGIEAALGAEGDIDNEPLANAYELVNAAKRFDEENPDGTLADWLHQVSLVSDIDGVELGGATTLMTLHAAKGLEFPVVYIVGLEEGMLPHRRAMDGGDDDIEEERRLFFVGMTRAMRRLTISRAKYRMVRGITERTLNSRFLKELPHEELEGRQFDRHQDRSRSHLRQENEREEFVDDSDYYPGQRVQHDLHGDGKVIRVESHGAMKIIRIDFDDLGEKTFALQHVELRVLE